MVCLYEADNDDNGWWSYVYTLAMILTVDDTYDIRRRDIHIR
jgi:hypothetical protein